MYQYIVKSSFSLYFLHILFRINFTSESSFQNLFLVGKVLLSYNICTIYNPHVIHPVSLVWFFPDPLIHRNEGELVHQIHYYVDESIIEASTICYS